MVTLSNFLDNKTFITIINADGQVLWFYEQTDFVWNVTWKPNTATLLYNVTGVNDTGGLIKEIDLDKNVIRELSTPENHHDTIEVDNTFYFISNENRFTLYPISETNPSLLQNQWVNGDVIFQVDKSGNLIDAWHLFDIIDSTRLGYLGLVTLQREGEEVRDWTHTNSVFVDHDNTIVVSVRNQDAVIKFDRNGNLKWIMGDHAQWKPEFEPYLLTPINLDRWQYHQHAVERTSLGTWIMFDNHEFEAIPPENPKDALVSRCLEVMIHEDTMEVEKIWDYESSLLNGFMGDCDQLPDTNNRLVTWSSEFASGGETRLEEVTFDKETVWEVIFGGTGFEDGYAVYRADRIR